VVPKDSRAKLAELLVQGVDIATFTSSSTVRNLLQLLDGDVRRLEGVTIAAIGPVTAETARGLGLRVDVVAGEYTIPGLVAALKAHFTANPAASPLVGEGRSEGLS